MIRPKTSAIGLVATTMVALFIIMLSVDPASGATATSVVTPPTPVIEASATPESTALLADSGAGVADAPLSPQLAPSTVSIDGSAPYLAPEALELNYCPVAPADDVLPDWAAAPPHRHGYCRCSCGYPCKTSADCGGSSCDPFITCC
jgi:hypothetical protein